MTRYIDANKIEYKTMSFPVLDGMLVRTKDIDNIVERQDIDNIPTANVQEVKHGKWVENGLEEKEGEVMYIRCFRCSECNGKVNEKFKFCPHCGAKMDAKKEKENE